MLCTVTEGTGNPTTRGDDPAAPRQVHLTLLAVQLMFGAFHVVGKALLGELHPFAVAALRVAIATPILLAVAWRRDRFLPSLQDLPILALLGLLGVFTNQLLFIIGLSHTTASNAAILMPSIPVFAAVLGAILGIQRLHRRQVLGVLSSVTGALILLEPTRFTLADETSLGNLLILLNCLSYAGFLVLQRPVLQRLPWRTVIAWCFLLGGSGVLAVGAPHLAALDLEAVHPATWAGVAYIAIFPTAMGYFLATWAVRRSSPALVAAYTTLQPLVSSVLAAIFLAERLGWHQAAGFALIATGLVWVSSRR